MYSRDFAKIYHNMLISQYIVGKKFTKLKFITKFFDKSIFSKSLKIIKILDTLNVYNVEKWYSSNKREITQNLLKHSRRKNEIFSTCEKVFTVKPSNLKELYLF